MRVYVLVGALIFANHYCAAAEPIVTPFSQDGTPDKWLVTDWSDLRKPAPADAHWQVKDGILYGSNPRGTWLMSEAEYEDFVLTFEWKIGERGNSGVALRSPMHGDPAFDGLEIQMVDPRYFPNDYVLNPSELTGSIYRAATPSKQTFRPLDWNAYKITCQGKHLKVVLNGVEIQNINLDEQKTKPLRHDGTSATALKDRPRKGHIGFQELSRGGGQVQIRNVRIQILDNDEKK